MAGKKCKTDAHGYPRKVVVNANLAEAVELACHSKACAPPPAGHGGSLPGMSGRTGRPVYAPAKPLYNFLGRINPTQARSTFRESNARIDRVTSRQRYLAPKLKKSTKVKAGLVSGLMGQHTQSFLKQRNLLKESITKLRKMSGKG